MSAPRIRFGSPFSVFWISWILLAALSSLWALATPVGGSPDEPAHMVKAASVVRGQFVGEPGVFGHIVQVPRYVAETHAETCYAFQPNVDAECDLPEPPRPAELIDGSTTAGLYNPVYYVLVGWPTLVFGDETGLYAMRIVSAILTSLIAALAFAQLATWARPAIPILAGGFTIAPMVIFLSGSVNPNALETAGTAATFVAMLGIVLHPDDARLRSRAVVLSVGAALAMNTRGLSPLWLVLAIGIPLLLVPGRRLLELLRRRAVIGAIIAVGLSAVAAVGWTIGSGSLTAGVGIPVDEQTAPGIGGSPLYGFAVTIRSTFEYAQSMIGNFGWLDTPAPFAVYFTWAVAVGVLLLLCVAVLRGRPLAVSILLIALFVFLPPIIQGAYITGGGIIWQGRYALPLFVCLVLGTAALLSSSRRVPETSALIRISAVLLAAWTISQVMSFVTALKRYAVGADDSWGAFLRRPEWSAPGGNLLLIALFTLVAAIAGAALFLGVRRAAGDAGSGDARSDDARSDDAVPDPADAPQVSNG